MGRRDFASGGIRSMNVSCGVRATLQIYGTYRGNLTLFNGMGQMITKRQSHASCGERWKTQRKRRNKRTVLRMHKQANLVRVKQKNSRRRRVCKVQDAVFAEFARC